MKRVMVQSVVLLCLLVVGVVDVDAAEKSSCLQCHADLGGPLSKPVGLWQASVHAENRVSCHDCHGGDASELSMEAMSPVRGFIGVPKYGGVPDFCGRCHIGVKEDYDASAHGLALNNGGAQCVLCHGDHAIKQADLDLINEQSCSRCHEYDRAAKIRTALAEVDSAIALLDLEIKQLFRTGIATRDMSGELFSVRNDFHRLFHNVDVEAVTAQSASFLERLEKTSGRVDSIKSDLGQRKLIGAVVVVLLIAAGILFLLLRRTYGENKSPR